MLGGTKDLLNIVLAFAVVWLTVFFCWMLYYLAMIFKNLREVLEETRSRFRVIEEGVKAIRERFEHATSSLTFISEGVIKLIQYIIERRHEKAEKDVSADEDLKPRKSKQKSALE